MDKTVKILILNNAIEANYLEGLLSAGSIVEIDQRVIPDALVQDREVLPDSLYIEPTHTADPSAVCLVSFSRMRRVM